MSSSIINCSSAEIFFLQPGWAGGWGASLMARLATKSQVPGQGKHDTEFEPTFNIEHLSTNFLSADKDKENLQRVLAHIL